MIIAAPANAHPDLLRAVAPFVDDGAAVGALFAQVFICERQPQRGRREREEREREWGGRGTWWGGVAIAHHVEYDSSGHLPSLTEHVVHLLAPSPARVATPFGQLTHFVFHVLRATLLGALRVFFPFVRAAAAAAAAIVGGGAWTRVGSTGRACTRWGRT